MSSTSSTPAREVPTKVPTELKELTALQAIFKDPSLKKPPFCTGTVSLDVNSSTLFYRSSDSDSKAEFIDFRKPTDIQLENLAKACEPATFGIKEKDVYDEAYRKAGKMDVDRFSMQFQPAAADHSIIKAIREELLGSDHGSLRMELYKLNIYGPGGFFKPHVDTPRGDNMFGSLVVVLPTVHEGGSLILRKDEKEWTFDSARTVRSMSSSASQSTMTQSCAATFIAFFSDVEHEVTPVSSGYRVTLTYNLYHDLESTTENDSRGSAFSDVEEKIKESLANLLKNPSFFPKGGQIGFGLDHYYAVNPKETYLEEIEDQLKGRDEAIKQICQSLSLKVSLKAVYRDDDDDSPDYRPRAEGGVAKKLTVLFDHFPYFQSQLQDDELLDYLENYGGKIVRVLGIKEASKLVEKSKTPAIVWVKPLADTNKFSQSYVTFGNSPELEYVYGELCLVAQVDSAKNRLRK